MFRRGAGPAAAAEDTRYTLTLTVGVVRHDPNRPPSLDALIAAADERLYEGKRARAPLPFRPPMS